MARKGGKISAFQGRAKQILIRLADNGFLTTNALHELLPMLQLTNISGYLDELRKEGFLKTEPGSHDKRLRYHSLTAKGREYLDGLVPEPLKVDEFYNEDLSRSQLHKFTGLEGEKEKEQDDEFGLDDFYNDDFSLETEEGEMLSF